MEMNMYMRMTFENSHNLQLWFDSWKFDSDSKYAGAIIGLFWASVGLELLLWMREWGRYFAAKQPFWIR
jgi:hypothetical protein